MNTSRKNKLAIAVVAAGALAVAGLGTAGIKDTRHNLGSTGSFNKSGQTGEICVFCHTPHGSASGASVPLWNRSLTSGANAYTTYDQLGTSSLDGAVVQVGSVSIACLSCHDGTQAMDVMINEPGSGLDSTTYNSGAAMTGDVVGAGTTGGDRMDNGDFDVAYLGTDLKNDHPIGIQYAGGGLTDDDADGRYANNNLFGDPDFKRPVKDTVNGLPIWWVPTVAVTGTAGDVNADDVVQASGASRSGADYATRNKTDMQLYTRALVSGATANAGTNGQFDISGTAPTATAAEPYVECASCHDPHSTNPTFLRVENTGSAVCLACHTK